MLAHEEAVDYFSLHKRKSKDVDVEMLDYEYVASCTDVDVLKNILVVLQSGKEGRYPPLEAAVEARLMEVLPPSETQRILRMKARPSETDIHSEAASLTAWEAQMASRSAELDAARKLSSRSLPPPRGGGNSAAPTVRISTKGDVVDVKPKGEKKNTIHAYDWRAWEKFDVDAAERELDMEDERRQDAVRQQKEELAARQARKRLDDAAMPASVDVAAMSAAEREVCAGLEKQKGNEAFRVGENDDAIRAYSRSLIFDPTSAVVFANRALVHLKLKNFSTAEDDCTMALRRDPLYFKAWSRRGMTRFRRGKYDDAISDFEAALRLEPQSREIQKLLQKTKEKKVDVDGIPPACPPQAPPQPPAAPFQRFEILEVDDEKEEEVTTRGAIHTAESSTREAARRDQPATRVVAEKPFQRFEILEDE
ncbi:hypothetical protein H257_09258 [Aphanomyces astaci]|uniref:Uncharacterized protein n=1 Tax=Aphanomyces astaci TaxID=112090 RepID=W4GCL2_APHAT|nr:hypothetical protein H257_09258 [Aphanomyces astaci]ETV76809.1 hypothetical protein H257_09258 [Aphanomyces astaci]|eukprot:XP_009833721.1 hypothetical protein H257_09258 [Aphanomyces astaci]